MKREGRLGWKQAAVEDKKQGKKRPEVFEYKEVRKGQARGLEVVMGVKWGWREKYCRDRKRN